ncbi:MAG: hypothetical protein HC916_02770 [Coleofasciculaceae cyanobacterium SM2_1_6]|nr:hypothetical protein [Coleofasciculaceae cyanobacterium SM2_1_6]
MPITNEGLKAMGFEEKIPPIILKCKFFCLKIYSINGIHFGEQDVEYVGRLNKYCTFGIGNDLNNICMRMIKDKYCDNQDEWIEEKKTSAPFLVTCTEDNIEYTGSCTWYKVDKETILTYESFSDAKSKINKLVVDYEIPYTLLITSQLTSEENLVKITQLDTCMMGLTTDGKYLQDISMRFSGEITTSKKVSLSESFNLVVSKVESYTVPGKSVPRLMYDSMQETDKLKAFIFAWIAIEILINKSYKGIPTDDKFPTDGIPSEYSDRINKLFNDPMRDRKITTPLMKYAYLSIFHWKFLTIYDYDVLKRISKIRNDFMHGEKSIICRLSSQR